MILVTGATGLIGSYIVRYLVQAGEKVRGLRLPDSDLSLLGCSADKIEWAEGSINDIVALEQAMEGIEKVYHADSFISFSSADQIKMLKINGEGTANVVNVALTANVQKLLYVSSIVSLGKGKPGVVLDESEENVDADYETSYSLSKSLAEMEVWRGMMEGLDAVIINPSIIIGAGYWDAPGSSIFNSVAKGFPFALPGSSGFVDVRDVARAAIQLMDSPVRNERFIVSADNLSYKEVFGMISTALEVKAPSIASVKSTSGIVATAESVLASIQGRKAVINHKTKNYFHSHFKYSNDKIKERINFQFTPLSKTIAETGKLFRQSKAQGTKYGVLEL